MWQQFVQACRIHTASGGPLCKDIIWWAGLSCATRYAGGLAAPALAAVAGSVMTTAGAGAAAGALTGFVGSSVGAAAVIGGFGVGGAHAVGSRMARRLGESTLTWKNLWHIRWISATPAESWDAVDATALGMHKYKGNWP